MAEAAVDWAPRRRQYAREGQSGTLTDVSTHPLEPSTPRRTQPSAASPHLPSSTSSRTSTAHAHASDAAGTADAEPLFDPLNAAGIASMSCSSPAQHEPVRHPLSPASDPLGANAHNAFSSANSILIGGVGGGAAVGEGVAGREGEVHAQWRDHCTRVLKEYTVSGQLKVVSALLDSDRANAAALGSSIDDDSAATEKKVMLDSKTRGRLEQLELSGSQTEQAQLVLTQRELVTRIDKLSHELNNAWVAEERVKALKTAIQVSKLLGETSQPKFYPSVFVLVTRMLDSFGELVYRRVLKKGTPAGRKLPEYFTPDEVLSEGTETTRNWFYKVASIRELVPRLYTEMAILQCYRLLVPTHEIIHVIERLSLAARGVGDPLGSCYARAYLLHKAIEVVPSVPIEVLEAPMWDMFTVFSQQLTAQAGVDQVSAKASITSAEYLGTFLPAVEWVMHCVASRQPTRELLGRMLKAYRESCQVSFVLNSILSSFPPALVSTAALDLCELIRTADAQSYPRYNLYVTLGRALCASPPPKDEQLQIVNEVWKQLAHIKPVTQYVPVVVQYVRFLMMEFTHAEVHKLLKDLLRRVTPNKAYMEVQPQLQAVVTTLLETATDFGSLFSMEPFLKLLACFDGAQAEANNRKLLDAFSKTHRTYSDPVLIHNLLHVARQLHDSLDSLSFEDDRRQLSALINAFIWKVSFGRDLERHLDFFVDCRAAFENLDAVKDSLVLGVAKLAMETHRAVKGRHTPRTSAFAKACVAFCFITIPSIESPLLRINLNLLTAQAALCNQLLPQTDACVKAAVSVVPEVLGTADAGEAEGAASPHQEANAREEAVVSLLSSALSLMVLMPGHPEHGPFYLLIGMLNTIQACKWQLPSSLPTLYIRTLSLLNAYAQERLPYHVKGVHSNDVLYAAEAEYDQQLRQLSRQTLETLLDTLAHLGTQQTSAAARVQASSALQLFDLVVGCSTLEPHLAKLALRLFKLARKSAVVNQAHLTQLAANVRSRAAVDPAMYGRLSQQIEQLLL